MDSQPASRDTATQTALEDTIAEMHDAFNEWVEDRDDLMRRIQSLILRANPSYVAIYRSQPGAPDNREYLSLQPDEESARRHLERLRCITPVAGIRQYGFERVTRSILNRMSEFEVFRVCGEDGSRFLEFEQAVTFTMAKKYQALSPRQPRRRKQKRKDVDENTIMQDI